MSNSRLHVAFSAFFAGLFLPLGVYLPFWPLWLEGRGLAPGEIGLVLGLGTWIRIATTPAIARWADRRGAERGTLVALSFLSLLIALAFLPAQGLWAILIVHLLWTVAINPIMPLGDSLALAAVREGGITYGGVRLWGSLAFILASLLAGWAVEGSGSAIVLPLVLGGLLLAAITAYTLPELGSGARSVAVPSLRLLLGRDFVIFIAAAGLLHAAHAVYYGFSAIAWKGAGLAGETVGWLWGLGVIAEVVLFAVGGKVIARMGALRLLLAAALGGLLRWCLLATVEALPLLVAAQLLHALTFGAAHLGAMQFLSERVPPGLAATGQALYTALSGGLFMGAMMLAAGRLYDRFGVAAYFAMTATSFLAGLLSIALLRLNSHKEAR